MRAPRIHNPDVPRSFASHPRLHTSCGRALARGDPHDDRIHHRAGLAVRETRALGRGAPLIASDGPLIASDDPPMAPGTINERRAERRQPHATSERQTPPHLLACTRPTQRGGGEGLGFSEMVAMHANLRKGDGSGKAQGAMREALSAAVAKEAARAAAVADGVVNYPEHVYESLEIMDEERVNIDVIAALVFHLDVHRPPGAILVFMPGDEPCHQLMDP